MQQAFSVHRSRRYLDGFKPVKIPAACDRLGTGSASQETVDAVQQGDELIAVTISEE